MQFLKDILYLFYPKICVTCKNNLLENEKTICTFCRHDLPILCYKNVYENEIINIFKGRVPVEKATAFLIFRKISKTKTLIHELKYKNNEEIGVFIGNWFGKILKNSNQFNDIDYIVPVPLHPKKLKKRGYNQLTKFGECLSNELEVTYMPSVLFRVSDTQTQTYKHRFERFLNANTKFSLTNTTVFNNKHILLIDDVITTGATIEACCKELLKTPNIKISIATMAYTEKL
ncbi:ComF family protein [Tenacibaculum sp. UWU-22]|uniref:ComF family protein n=1 Tax=Tenacibaculum sp. UWU-22 TaxID=3234187 RepID=UPI0034DADECE